MKSRLFLALAALSACATPPEPASTATYFHGMRLLPGGDAAPFESAAMVVDEGGIVAVGPADSVEAPAGAARVDLSGRTVMPLLHSLHVHVGYVKDNVMAAENYTRNSIVDDLNRHLHYGVGSVLVVGSDVGEAAFAIRDEQKQGSLGGARLFTVGRGITSVEGWPTQIPAMKDAPQQVATEEEARLAVRALAEQKVDAVKIWVDDGAGKIAKISPELSRAVIDEAKTHGLRVVAHVFYLEDAKMLVDAGVAGLIHSIRDREVDDELAAAMKDKGVYYVPTLSAHQSAIGYAEEADWVGEPSMRETVPAAIVESLTSDEFVESQKASPTLPATREQYALALSNLRKLSEAGVPIGLGTDSGTPSRFPGFFEHREIELMVEAGLTPQQAIAAATTSSAEFLGLEGALVSGNDASFLVLRSDPLAGIRATRDIEAVYRKGEKIDRERTSIRTNPSS
jgi:imidazolonepropionase-like amidohydrolase